jgi:LSD1 subclass zinc finger protein
LWTCFSLKTMWFSFFVSFFNERDDKKNWVILVKAIYDLVWWWFSGAQSQLVCSGCRNLLLYPVGATSVCCAVCNAVTAVPPPGTSLSIISS